MAATPIPFSTKDNSNSTLASGISANTLSIPLASGGGAAFPQPYNGTATSGGTSTTLNATGISATIGGSAQVGKFIWNFTDGSVAVITAVATNSVTTTALLGGTSNTWGNSQQWRIDPFVLTLEKHDSATPYNVTQREEVLVYGRSTDTLSVYQTSDRGYNGTTAATFASSDYVYLHVTAPIVERFKDVVAVLAQQIDTNTNSITTTNTNVTNLQTGTYHYVVTTGSANAYVAATPALAAYAAGNVVVFKANFANTAAATLNLNSLGAKTIKKVDGATDLAANDIANGQIVVVRYDGTNFQMVSPIGQVTAAPLKNLGSVTTASSSVGSSSTAENTMSPTWTGTATVPVNQLGVGSKIHIVLGGGYRQASGNLDIRVKIGGTLLVLFHNTVADDPNTYPWYADITAICTATGASGSVLGSASFVTVANETIGASTTSYALPSAVTVDTTGTLAISFTAQFSASNANHGCTIQNGAITIYAVPS